MKLYVYLKSYNKNLLEKFCKKAYIRTGSLGKGPIRLPRKKKIYTVIRSPHVHSLSREQFEVVTYRRLFVFKFQHFSFSRSIYYMENIIPDPVINFNTRCSLIYKFFSKVTPVGVNLKIKFKN